MIARRRLKIEMVLPTLEAAGMEILTARLTRGLADRGHDVGVTCIQDGGVLADELRTEGRRVEVIPAPGVRSNLRAPKLEEWFKHLRPDVVHAHSGTWLKSVRAARHAAVSRVIHTEHGLLDPEPWYSDALRRWAARFTDCVVSVSTPLRDYLVHRVRLDPRKVRVIPNGVSTEQFDVRPRTGALRKRLGIPELHPVIGNVARLDAIKNHALLIDAFALLHMRIPEASLVIVGEGVLREALEARIAKQGLRPYVHLLGMSRDVATILSDLDLFVLSSTAEGTPMSLLEAMASGVCVVSTAVGGIPDLLGQGRYGWLVPPDDPHSLAETMGTVLRDANRRGAVAAAAREHVVARYSESAMLGAYEELYYSRVPHDNSSWFRRTELTP